MMHLILNKEKTHLHIMIRSMLVRIDTILQEQISLQVQEEKMRRVFQIITKIAKDLEAEDDIVL